MNSRQRRGVILLVVSVLCALAAFAGVLALIRNVQSKVGPETSAYELQRGRPAYRTLSAAQFTKVSMPERWLPKTAVTDLADVRGKIATSRLHKGSLLQSDMIAGPARPEARGAGDRHHDRRRDRRRGQDHAGQRVNIFATFAGGQQSGGKGRTPTSPRSSSAAPGSSTSGSSPPFKESDTSDERTRQRERDGVPITFALDTTDAQRVAYAESFAEHVRLALVAPGDGTRSRTATARTRSTGTSEAGSP